MASEISAIGGSESWCSGWAGAKPPACSTRFCSRSGTASSSQSRRIIAGVGRDRPVSTKLTCRVETPARDASSSWDRFAPLPPLAQQHPGVLAHDARP